MNLENGRQHADQLSKPDTLRSTTTSEHEYEAPPPPPPLLTRVSHGIEQRRHKGEDRTAQLQSGAIATRVLDLVTEA